MTLGQAGWEGQALGLYFLSSKPLCGGSGNPFHDKAHPGSQSTATTNSTWDGDVSPDSILIMFLHVRGWILLCRGRFCFQPWRWSESSKYDLYDVGLCAIFPATPSLFYLRRQQRKRKSLPNVKLCILRDARPWQNGFYFLYWHLFEGGIWFKFQSLSWDWRKGPIHSLSEA